MRGRNNYAVAQHKMHGVVVIAIMQYLLNAAIFLWNDVMMVCIRAAIFWDALLKAHSVL